MTAKIAPTLVYAHKPVPTREIAQGRGIGVRSYHAASAWRELRALLRIWTAAKRMARLTRASVDKGDQVCLTEVHLMLAVEKTERQASRGARRGGR